MINHAFNPSVSENSTLLVLRQNSGNFGIVQSVDPSGNLIDVKPDESAPCTVMRIGSSPEEFMDCFSEFYNQLKNPEHYSFFKVREFEAVESAKVLQAYWDVSTPSEKLELKDFEVSIDTIESLRKTNEIDNTIGKDLVSGNASADDASNYRFSIEDINWTEMAELGLDKAGLQELDILDLLLKGYKTPMLISVRDGNAIIDARLQFRMDDNGEVVLHVHKVQNKVDFRKKFLGHRFSKEDRMNLLTTGNMGREVELVNPVTGEVVPSLVSLDKLTNELFSLRMEFVRIPELVCGVAFNKEQREILASGKALFVENLVSKRNHLFNATLQFNAERQGFEFFFNRKLEGNGFEFCVPPTFRGVTLRRWQLEKLKAGEGAYIRGIISRNGKKYQGYIRFDKKSGSIDFSFKKPC
ncbi:DUF3945 domain-containing protein [Epilithonimonas mollis]|uniref:Uncharacterized protein n=1 Tax=Epilithonimonas mollis TaxID=216903 RepID=A0A1M6UQ33_9FLAO|nr:DUF3945 domain-containing protein [Epilithonimonas mollis]SHK71317.1 Protein of unknown function [Epilithonimonas mollis]